MDEPRKRLAAEMSWFKEYSLRPRPGHPLLGRRVPDLDLVTATGPRRVFTLLHDDRPVLLNLGEPGGVDITLWADRVQSVYATYVGAWELPAIGAVTAPAAVLIRPDGSMWPGWETEPVWAWLTRSPRGSERLLPRCAPASEGPFRWVFSGR